MLEQILADHVWVTIALWAALYISDYQLTITSARLYARDARQYSEVEGSYELNPFFEEDVDALRRFSPRFFVWLILISLFILLAWFVSFQLEGAEMPGLYFGALGVLFLREAAIHIRHVRNLSALYYAARGEGLSGRLFQARWLVLRLSAVDLLCFTALYLFSWLVSSHPFFLGGAFGCGLLAVRQWLQSDGARVLQPTAGATEPDGS
ncbi:MAG: hypothetical protein PVJ34_22800 [Anaerolineae bacterium]